MALGSPHDRGFCCSSFSVVLAVEAGRASPRRLRTGPYLSVTVMLRRLSRRTFMRRIGTLTASWAIGITPHGADAQRPSAMRYVGVLLASSLPDEMAQAFRRGLLEAGYVEGTNVLIEWRTAKGNYDRAQELASDLVQRGVNVIVVDSTVAARAAKWATATIPIVMATVADPVGSGLVSNLAHPGQNITGLSLMATEVAVKRLQLLKEMLPRLSRVVVLRNPDNPSHTKVVEDLKASAPSLSVELSVVDARTVGEFEAAFSTLNRSHAAAVFMLGDALFFANRAALLKLASRGRVPVVSGERYFADEGALMSYGTNFADVFRRAAGYVGKILKGATPGDLPIEQPTKFDLVINLRTARALGLAIPPSLLARADHVIE
jgi:putative tryptophan/tyrosine transport system substrate-binding protein